ncbi:MAG: thiamine pyrophosphate-binding protein [Candidatus Woesearchaeota archaeon]
MDSKVMKASDYIAKYIEKVGVRHVFGYTGGAVTHIVDSIYTNGALRFVSLYNEQAASYAVSAVSKYTSKLGVAVATSGPGITNMITGIAESYFDSTPVLFISGQVNTYDFKYDMKVRQKGFQETDIIDIVRPITKYCVRINSPEELEPQLKKAVGIALSGRKGPVLLDIPMNMQRSDITVSESSFDMQFHDDKSLDVNNKESDLGKLDGFSHLDDELMEKIFSMIKEAKMPLILAGGGCSSAFVKKELLSIAENLDIPVVVSLMGKDSFPHKHRLFGGFIGSYGNRFGNILLAHCDLLIVLGSRLDSRQTGNVLDIFSDKKMVWVDIDKNEMECSRMNPTINLHLDLRVFLEKIMNYIKDNGISLKNTEMIDTLSMLKERYAPATEAKRADKEDWHYTIFNMISESLDKEDVVCVDVGQNQMLAAQTMSINHEQRFINSGGMAPMGYSLPAAIGISKDTGKRCVVICGDGGLQMNIQELNALKHNKLPVIIVVLNNKSLGMIKQFQELYFNSRYFATEEDSGYHSCDFKKIAEAYGIQAYRINRKSVNVEDILKKVFNNKSEPVLLELDIDYNTHIYPKLRFDKPINRISPELSEEEEMDISKMIEKIKKG